MTNEEMWEHAMRIGTDRVQHTNYSDVYEDEDLEDATEDERLEIHNRILEMVATPILID